MKTHTAQTSQSKAVAETPARSSTGPETKPDFVDNRPEAIAQRQLKEAMNNSPRNQQMAQLQSAAAPSGGNPAGNPSDGLPGGLPGSLKSGIENLSGYSMDDVKVHYNSGKPAQLNAHAYAQGTDIHIVSGQEKHLPHEAWHVVQQKQGRVKPTLQMQGGVNVNDDAGLEKEADVMGARAANSGTANQSPAQLQQLTTEKVVQRVIKGGAEAVGTYVFNRAQQKYYEVNSYDGQKSQYEVCVAPKKKKPKFALIGVDDDNYVSLPPTVGHTFSNKDIDDYIESKGGEYADLVKSEFDLYIDKFRIVVAGFNGNTTVYKASDELFEYINTRVESFSDKRVAEESGKKQLKNIIYGFFSKNINVDERLDAISDKYLNKNSYKDWFHGLTHMINLLSSRLDHVEESEIAQMLKYHLTRFQLQATYSADDGKRMGRSSSPLVMQGYARGIKTGLWNMYRRVQEVAVNQQLRDVKGNELGKKFFVFPVNKVPESTKITHPETGDFLKIKVEEKVPKGINDIPKTEGVFVKTLKVLIVKFESAESKNENVGAIHSQMGGKGLRTSAGESADKVAAVMAAKIKAGKVADAMSDVKKAFETNSEATTGKVADSEVSPEGAFEGLEFRANTMIIPYQKGGQEGPVANPLTATPFAFLEDLAKQYSSLIRFEENKHLPFFVKQNIAIVKGLIGGSIGRSKSDYPYFFDQETPATICRDLMEALFSACEVVKHYASLIATLQPTEMEDIAMKESSVLIEEFYQQMQNIHHIVRFQLKWKKGAGNMKGGLKNMLPDGFKAPTLINVAPHGLEMIHHIQQSLSEGDQKSVAFMAGAYYETPDLFPGADEKQHVSDESLKDKKVIVMEPHPNNAASKDIHPHDPLELLDTLYGGGSSNTHTVIMDVTLNHLGEDQIKAVLEKAQPIIESGKLNLILLQSGTKFFQSGMDLVSIGTALTFNDKGDHWKEFNDKMGAHEESVPEDDQLYVSRMLTENKEPLKDYLDKIRTNTLFVRKSLTEKLQAGDNAFHMCGSSDQSTVYVSFMPKDIIVHRYLADKRKADQGSIAGKEQGSLDFVKMLSEMINGPAFIDLREELGDKKQEELNELLSRIKKKKVPDKDVPKEIGKLGLDNTKLMLHVGKIVSDTNEHLDSHDRGEKKEKALRDEEVAYANRALYFDKLLPYLKSEGFPAVDRSSFGFNVTNFGECYTTIRMTMGIEEKGLLEAYCKAVDSVGKQAWKTLMTKSDA